MAPRPPLGRIVRHDPASLGFPAAVGPVVPIMHVHHGRVLNQGRLGSCTANAVVQSLMTGRLYRGPKARPATLANSERCALSAYTVETELQGGPVYPPNDPGGSGLGIAKAASQLGWIASYTHAFGIDHASEAISVSPFLVGSNWYEGMFQPDGTGTVSISGAVAGGHEYVCIGYDPNAGVWSFLNSWGSTWADHGRFHMTTSTFARLLSEQGDVTVPVLA